MADLAGDTQYSERKWHLRPVANGLLPPLAWVAEVDRTHGVVILVHACSAEGSNNGRFKPIDFLILG